MNSLLNTKPLNPETCPSSTGWVDINTGELIVAIRDLDKKLNASTLTESPVKRRPGGPKKKK